MSLKYTHAPGSVVVVIVHHFQMSSPLKPLDQSMPILCGALLGRGNESLYKWSRSHDQDGRHAHIWLKPLKIFSRTRSPRTLKIGMQHKGLKLYKDYINDDPGLTLAYFRARSNCVTYTFKWGKLLQSHCSKVLC